MDETLLASLAKRYALADCSEWRSLLRLLDFAEGFAFIPLILPDAAGAEICRRELTKHLTAEGKSLHPLHLAPVEKDGLPLQPLLDLAIPEDAGVLWITPDPDLWADDARYDPDRTQRFEEKLWPLFCNHANQARDVIRTRFSIPLILVGTDLLRANLRLHAPDLWSIRDAVIRPEPDQDALEIASFPTEARFTQELLPDPIVSGDLSETLNEIERIKINHPDSPSLPILLLRAAALERKELFRQQAVEHLKECLAYYEAHGAEPTEIWDVEEDLTLALLEIGHTKEAEFHAMRALQIADEFLSGNIWRPGHSLGLVSRVMEEQGRLTEAEGYARRQVESHRKTSSWFGLNTATALANLGDILALNGKIEEAETTFREAVAILKADTGSEESFLEGPLSHLASFLENIGRFEEAETHRRWILRSREKSEEQQDSSVAWAAFSLAGVLEKQGKLLEAEQLCVRGVEILRTQKGENHPSFGMALENLAGCLRLQGRLEEAEDLIRKSMAILKERVGIDHQFWGHSLRNLSRTLRLQGKLEEARETLIQALGVFVSQRLHNSVVYPYYNAAVTEYHELLKEMNSPEGQFESDLNSLQRRKS